MDRNCVASCRRRFRVEQPGNPEVEQLRFAIICDADVGWFDVAMNDQMLMGVADRGANFEKQLQARSDRQCAFIAET